MNVNDIISSGLLELYAAGLSSKEETLQVEQWAAEHPEVKAELAGIERSLERYAMTNAIEPDASVKEKVFDTIQGGLSEKTAIIKELNISTPAKVISMRSYWKMAAAAFVVLLIGSAVLNVVLYDKYSTANKGLAETKELLAQEMVNNDEMKHDMGIVQNPYSMPVVLKEMDSTLDTKAKIFWMQNTGEVMVDASHLPDAPAGKQYQFWAIVDGQPVSGGMIVTNNKGMKYRMQPMKSFGKAQAFAISLEKEGGNPTPTKVVSMGKVI